MKVSTLGIVAAAAPLVICGAARGGYVGLSIEQLPMDEFPGLLTWRVYAQFDGTQGQNGDDFLFHAGDTPLAPVFVGVRGGTFFQHPANTHADGDLSPDPGICLDDPWACMDTFVTIGRDTAVGDWTALDPGWPGFDPDSLGPCTGCDWYITPEFPQGLPDENDRVLVMQVSTADGVGFHGYFLISGFSDGTAFQEIPTFDTGCHADADGDGEIGIGDLLLVIAQWGPCPPTCLGDVTANGDVGIWDLLEVLAQWGSCE